MHEMSIAEGILDVALDTFCWEAVTKGTPAEGSRIEINTIPIEGKCLDCDKTFPVENYKFICPHCDSHFVQTIGGRELQVTSMDID